MILFKQAVMNNIPNKSQKKELQEKNSVYYKSANLKKFLIKRLM